MWGEQRSEAALANFLGDETAMNYISEERFGRFRTNLLAVAEEAPALRRQPLPTAQLEEAISRLFREFF